MARKIRSIQSSALGAVCGCFGILRILDPSASFEPEGRPFLLSSVPWALAHPHPHAHHPPTLPTKENNNNTPRSARDKGTGFVHFGAPQLHLGTWDQARDTILRTPNNAVLKAPYLCGGFMMGHHGALCQRISLPNTSKRGWV